MKKALLLPSLIILLGFILRINAFRNNIFLHGDVATHCAVVDTVAKEAKLIVPFAGIHQYPVMKFGWGYPLDASNPMWAILGGVLRKFVLDDCFIALKILSLFSGLILIPLTYLLTKSIFNRKSALFSSLCVAISYLLIDYSGNGAMYSLQADFFIIFIFLANKLPLERKISWLILGITAGFAYLLSYQDVVLAGGAMTALVYLLLVKKYSISKIFFMGLAFSLGLLITITPWLWRNFQLFGNPLFNTNFEYAYSKLGIASAQVMKEGELVTTYNLAAGNRGEILIEIIKMFIGNCYYFLRKILLLAPIISLFAVIPFIKKRSQGLWAIGGLLVCYLGLNLIWPTFKFRFFVPVLPLVFILGAGAIMEMKRWRILMIVSLFSLTIVSILTYQSNPFHTYYYDGAITVDQFGSHGEDDFTNQEPFLVDIGRFFINRHDSGAILTNNTVLYYYARHKIVQGGVSNFLISTYNPEYLVVPINKEVLVPAGEKWPQIYANNGFKVFQLKNETN